MLGEAVRDLRGRTRGELMEPGDYGLAAPSGTFIDTGIGGWNAVRDVPWMD
ncbi:MAG: hypothetical protein ACJ771_13625 [Chloroflexota bacterium]